MLGLLSVRKGIRKGSGGKEEQAYVNVNSNINAMATAAAVVTALLRATIERNRRIAMILAEYPRYRLPLPPRAPGITFKQLTDTECLGFFRFTRREMQQILLYFTLDQIIYRYRRRVSPKEAFCALLARQPN